MVKVIKDKINGWSYLVLYNTHVGNGHLICTSSPNYDGEVVSEDIIASS